MPDDSGVLDKLNTMLSAAKRDGDREEANILYDTIREIKDGHASTAKALADMRAELDALKTPAAPEPDAKADDEPPAPESREPEPEPEPAAAPAPKPYGARWWFGVEP